MCIAGYTLFAQKKDTVASKFKTEFISLDNDLSESAAKYIKKGDFIFSLGPLKYERALEEYFKALDESPDNSFLNFKVGYCYLNINKFKSRSILYLEKALNGTTKKVDPKIRFYLAEAYQVNHNPERAIEEYKKYIVQVKKELKPETKGVALELVELSRLQEKAISDAYKKIDECNNLVKHYKTPVKLKLANLGDSVNSPYADYDPFISLDESDLYFTSRRPSTKGGGKAEKDGEYYEDIYVSHKKNGKWVKAKPLNGMNKNTNDAITGLSFDGTKMFIYRDVNGGDIYMSELKSGWSKLKNLKEINSEFHESSACMSVDGKTLYFVSDRPGGEGGRDIYMSTLDAENKWGKPVNMGSDINTSFDEDRIYVHPYTKALFFSSKGHNSLGGYDIFVCEYQNGTWAKPKNLGYPVNDVDDDFSFVVTDDMKHGYYSSFKENGKGDKDIYFIDFENTETDTTLKGLNVDFKKIAYDDSVNAAKVAQQLKMGQNPLAYLDQKQLHILDSLAIKNGKISQRLLQKTNFGDLPLNTVNLNILDSIAKADKNITAAAIDKVINSNKDLAAIDLNRKQLGILDSLAKTNQKITPELLQKANFNARLLSAAQLRILDSIARENRVILAKEIAKTNFAGLNVPATVNNTTSSENINPRKIESIFTKQQLHFLDSIAKADGNITATALDKVNFFSTDRQSNLDNSSSANIKPLKGLTPEQLHVLDSLVKSDGGITAEALNKANFAAVDSKAGTASTTTGQNNKTDVANAVVTNKQVPVSDAQDNNVNKKNPAGTDKTVSQTNNHTLNNSQNARVPALSPQQVHILDSLVRADKVISIDALGKTKFDEAALPVPAANVQGGKIPVKALSKQQIHILDSLVRADGNINTVALNKTNFANTDQPVSNTNVISQNKPQDEAVLPSFTAQQVHILDSLAKANKTITEADLRKSNFIVDTKNVSTGENNISKANKTSVGLTPQQLHVLDSLAKADEGISTYALGNTNFKARDAHASQRTISIQHNVNYAADEALLTEQQLHILDSLAKTNKEITISALNKTKFAEAAQKNPIYPTAAKNNSAVIKTLNKEQIRILDSIAKANGSITANAVKKSEFANVTKTTSSESLTTGGVDRIVPGTNLSVKQIRILDSLARTNKKITAATLTNTTFGVIIEYKNGSILASSLVDTSGTISFTAKQMHILDSIARKKKSITASMLIQAHFVEAGEYVGIKTAVASANFNKNNTGNNEQVNPNINTDKTDNDQHQANNPDNALIENDTDTVGIKNRPPVFKNILFDFNKNELNEAGKMELDNLIAYLKLKSSDKVSVTGFADSKGSDTYNLALSKKRALAVSAYLSTKGINKTRIKSDYKGESHPVAPNENPDKSDNVEGRTLNRRVETKIISGNK